MEIQKYYGRTYGRTDGRTDGRTSRHTELLAAANNKDLLTDEILKSFHREVQLCIHHNSLDNGWMPTNEIYLQIVI